MRKALALALALTSVPKAGAGERGEHARARGRIDQSESLRRSAAEHAAAARGPRCDHERSAAPPHLTAYALLPRQLAGGPS